MRDVRVLEGRPDTEHLGIGLRLDEAREAVAGLAADALAVRPVVLEQPNAAGRMERVVAGALEVVGQLLDARLVGQRRERVLGARVALGRILAMVAVDLVQVLGLRVVRLHVVVRDRPGRRDPAVVADLPEILGPEPVEGGAIELRRATDRVVDPGLERLVRLVVPGLLGHVPVVDEDFLGVPVLPLARQPVTALEDQDPLARWRKVPRQGAASGSAPDDDDVVPALARHDPLPCRLRGVVSWPRRSRPALRSRRPLPRPSCPCRCDRGPPASGPCRSSPAPSS